MHLHSLVSSAIFRQNIFLRIPVYVLLRDQISNPLQNNMQYYASQNYSVFGLLLSSGILCVIHHRQNTLESTNIIVVLIREILEL
jgi:Na+-translocating ferredoxin:NAD+ oxidoreductase RnfE subunit